MQKICSPQVQFCHARQLAKVYVISFLYIHYIFTYHYNFLALAYTVLFHLSSITI